jgi:SHS2 domain-containing protein
MKFIFLLSLICYFHIDSVGQTKKIKGRIIAEDLESLPGTWIENADTTLIAQTDINGNFEIEIPKENYKLMFRSIGMEWTVIELNNNCNIIEVIIDFIRIKSLY